MSRPEVSVVMAVYDAARTLRRAVASVLQQADVDFEFVIVNDGSTDASRAVLEDFAARDARIRLLHQENQGLTRCLMRGCAEARGGLVVRQDADDFSLPGRVKALVELARGDARLAFVSSWTYVIGPDSELLSEERGAADPERATYDLLHRRIGPRHGSVMFRRSAYEHVGGYRQEFPYAQDRDLWLRLAEFGLLGYCQSFLYAYECGETSISSRAHDAQQRLGGIIDECRARRLAGEDEAPALAQAAEVRRLPEAGGSGDPTRGAYLIAGYLRQRRDSRAVAYYARVLRRRPTRLDAWCWLVWSCLLCRRSRRRNVGRRGVAPVGAGER